MKNGSPFDMDGEPGRVCENSYCCGERLKVRLVSFH